MHGLYEVVTTSVTIQPAAMPISKTIKLESGGRSGGGGGTYELPKIEAPPPSPQTACYEPILG